jgi:hypothetical protein
MSATPLLITHTRVRDWRIFQSSQVQMWKTIYHSVQIAVVRTVLIGIDYILPEKHAVDENDNDIGYHTYHQSIKTQPRSSTESPPTKSSSTKSSSAKSPSVERSSTRRLSAGHVSSESSPTTGMSTETSFPERLSTEITPAVNPHNHYKTQRNLGSTEGLSTIDHVVETFSVSTTVTPRSTPIPLYTLVSSWPSFSDCPGVFDQCDDPVEDVGFVSSDVLNMMISSWTTSDESLDI